MLNMAVREGLTRCARPTGSPLTAFVVCPTGCRQLLNPQSRVLIPPFRENINEKSPYFRTSSHLKYGGEGGMDSLRSPFGQPTHCVRGLSNWLSPVVEPSVEGSHPSRRRATCEKKSPHFHASSSSNMAVREGLTRCARPSGSPLTAFVVCPTGCRPLSNPQSRVLITPAGVLHAKKKPAFSCELFFKYGGEGGIRTLDTLPYTHFPGVLLQPLGHLTILLSRCCWDGR